MNLLSISFYFSCFAQRGGETQGLCVDGQIQGGVPAPIGVFRDPVHPIALRLARKRQGVDLGVGICVLSGIEGPGAGLPGGVVGEGDGPALYLGCEVQPGRS